MATQLGLFNGALRLCEERKLATLTDAVESQRLLTDVWNDNGVQYCLEQGLWNFAVRSMQVNYDPSITTQFGYRFAFAHPTDWIRTAAVCSDPYYDVPLTRYRDETGFWYSDVTPLYVKYVSNDPSFGQNLGDWPETFNKFVQAYFASQIVHKLTKNERVQKRVMDAAHKLLTDARSKDAMDEGAMFPPMGTWTGSRYGRNWRWDRGNRNQLIG